MSSLVLELQQDALDSTKSASDLLRKAYLVSLKLNITDLSQWIENELNGYGNDLSTYPEYRYFTGMLKGFNPFYGWQTVVFADHKIEEIISKCAINQSVDEIEHLLKSLSEGKEIAFPISSAQKVLLQKAMNINVELTRFLNPTALTGIISAVRNTILKWSLELEQVGVLGEGMSFSQEEKQQASTIHIGSIQNFQGVVGTSTGNINIANNNTLTAEQISALQQLFQQSEKAISRDDSIEEVQKKAILNELQLVNEQLAKPNINSNVIVETIKSLRSLLEGAAGNIVASGILSQLHQMGLM